MPFESGFGVRCQKFGVKVFFVWGGSVLKLSDVCCGIDEIVWCVGIVSVVIEKCLDFKIFILCCIVCV